MTIFLTDDSHIINLLHVHYRSFFNLIFSMIDNLYHAID
ncbi:hypothetical protein L289_2129 [Acinetobacter gerneri DSM 14967 = CIP 107464 = MTCC 9824]|nr:hypothetical protein L289_2129 [Acinetobacter gerneri DSM 14967 = CIP 107464 = MTCC 9824]